MIDNEGKPYIELNVFVKLKMSIATGGQAKTVIRSGVINVNGEVCTQNKKKLYPGDVVDINGKKEKVELQGEQVV